MTVYESSTPCYLILWGFHHLDIFKNPVAALLSGESSVLHLQSDVSD